MNDPRAMYVNIYIENLFSIRMKMHFWTKACTETRKYFVKVFRKPSSGVKISCTLYMQMIHKYRPNMFSGHRTINEY